MSTETVRRKWTGAPWWAVGLGATALVAAGAALGYFAAAIVTGCVLAALVAEREAFFAVLAQPPLITAAVGLATVLLGRPLLSTAVELSTTFPYLAATMLAVAAVVIVRRRLATSRVQRSEQVS